jgi:hypothetical protein
MLLRLRADAAHDLKALTELFRRFAVSPQPASKPTSPLNCLKSRASHM